MKSSFRLGLISGIGIFAHWTFIVMLVGLFGFYLFQGLSIGAAISAILLVVAVFGCVVLHELGHAFMARRFGIPTLDITMYPIGGIARLQRMPRKPREEFLIAVAGPAVNLAIAGALYVINSILGLGVSLNIALHTQAGVLGLLMWINLGLVVFNLIPAFPMDGGRVLRAALASQMAYRTATHVASLIGQGFAFVFGIAGLVTGNWSLPIVAVFVFMAARQEVQYVMENG